MRSRSHLGLLLGAVSASLLLLGVGCVTAARAPKSDNLPPPGSTTALAPVDQNQDAMQPARKNAYAPYYPYDTVCVRSEDNYWDLLDQYNAAYSNSFKIDAFRNVIASKKQAGWTPAILCFGQGQAYFSLQADDRVRASLESTPVISLVADKKLRAPMGEQSLDGYVVEELGYWNADTQAVVLSEPIAIYRITGEGELDNLRLALEDSSPRSILEASTSGGDMGFAWQATVRFNGTDKKTTVRQCRFSSDLTKPEDPGRTECNTFE